MEYLDFDLEVGTGRDNLYPVAVVRSPAGEATGALRFPYSAAELESRLKDLQIALLNSDVTRGSHRRLLSLTERPVQEFGRALFLALLPDDLRGCYEAALAAASSGGQGLRVKLRLQAPELAALPWEYLFDPHQEEYLALSRRTPLVRYLQVPRSTRPLAVAPPLRVLGVVASPQDPDLDPLDVDGERRRVETALRGLSERGLLELTWLPGQTFRDIQRAMRAGPWHALHFIGHGGFDTQAGEGLIALADEAGGTQRLSASQLGLLLSDHDPLRLAVLNMCEGARGSPGDLYSASGATLVRHGVPAVLAMQYEISDSAAIEFARAFYEAVADGLAVDAAVTEGRIAIRLAVPNTVEWGTPVLYTHAPDGVLFELARSAAAPSRAAPPAEVPSRIAVPAAGPARGPVPSSPASASAASPGAAAATPRSAGTAPPTGSPASRAPRDLPGALLALLLAALLVSAAALLSRTFAAGRSGPVSPVAAVQTSAARPPATALATATTEPAALTEASVAAMPTPAPTGSIRPSDPPRPVHIGVPGQKERLAFAGRAGQRVSARATESTIDVFDLDLLAPDGRRLGHSVGGQGSFAFLDTVALPAAGTYTVLLDPGGHTGDATLTLYDVPPDITGSIAADGQAHPLTVTTPGQKVRLTLHSAAGQRLSVRTAATSIQAFDLDVLQPNGDRLGHTIGGLGSEAFLETLALPLAGDYTVRLDPGSHTGATNLTLFTVP